MPILHVCVVNEHVLGTSLPKNTTVEVIAYCIVLLITVNCVSLCLPSNIAFMFLLLLCT